MLRSHNTNITSDKIYCYYKFASAAEMSSWIVDLLKAFDTLTAIPQLFVSSFWLTDAEKVIRYWNTLYCISLLCLCGVVVSCSILDLAELQLILESTSQNITLCDFNQLLDLLNASCWFEHLQFHETTAETDTLALSTHFLGFSKPYDYGSLSHSGLKHLGNNALHIIN